MITFLALAALLTVAALILLLPTLWRGNSALDSVGEDQSNESGGSEIDQHAVNVEIAKEQLDSLRQLELSGALTADEFNTRRLEIEKNLASSLSSQSASGSSNSHRAERKQGRKGVFSAAIVALLFPLAAALTYWQLGKPEALDPEYIASQTAASNEKLPPVEELLPRLEAHLATNPDDQKGWTLLGVTYLRMQRYAEASTALEKALALDPANADLMLQLADATALRDDGKLQGIPETLIRRSLSLRPQDPRGLWMLGMLHHQQGDIAGAVAQWQKLLPLLKEQPRAYAEVEQLIAEAQGDDAAIGNGTANTSDVETDDQATSLKVKVALSQTLKARVKNSDVVYIYAKAHQGPPMPLAVVRITAGDLPFTATLDDSQAMMPAMKISDFDNVIVGARVSFSGDPIAKPGDFFSEKGPIGLPGASTVSLEISDTVK